MSPLENEYIDSNKLDNKQYMQLYIWFFFSILMFASFINIDINSDHQDKVLQDITYYNFTTSHDLRLSNDINLQTLMNEVTKVDDQNTLKEHHLIDIKFPSELLEEHLIHISGIKGTHYRVYDEDFQLIEEIENRTNFLPYTYFFNGTYMHVEGSGVYVEVTSNSRIMATDYTSSFSLSDLNDAIPTFKFRLNTAFFMLILSLIFFLVAIILKDIFQSQLMVSLGQFSGMFGAWVIFDFNHNAYWIVNAFKNMPHLLLLIIFVLSSNYLMCIFLKLNISILKSNRYTRYIKILYWGSLLLATVTSILELIKLFYWSETLQTLYYYDLLVFDYAISIGSLLLIIITWLDKPFHENFGLVYSIGLTGSLITFTITQATPYLISHWGVIWLVFSIVYIMSRSFLDSQQKLRGLLVELKKINEYSSKLNEELEFTQEELLMRLGSTVDLRSKETSQHVQRVSKISYFIAIELGYSEKESKTISLASTLHDIGKVGIPDRILNQPGKLSNEDYNDMKAHSRMGYDILNGSYSYLMDIAAIIALTHHERYDGNGYPDGLSGDNIPMYGTIVAAADVFDALLSERVYKKAWSYEEVYKFFKEQRGKHFHPEVTDIVIEHYEELKEMLQELQ